MQESLVGEVVVTNYISLFQGFQPSNSQQIGIAGTKTHETNLSVVWTLIKCCKKFLQCFTAAACHHRQMSLQGMGFKIKHLSRTVTQTQSQQRAIRHDKCINLALINLRNTLLDGATNAHHLQIGSQR